LKVFHPCFSQRLKFLQNFERFILNVPSCPYFYILVPAPDRAQCLNLLYRTIPFLAIHPISSPTLVGVMDLHIQPTLAQAQVMAGATAPLRLQERLPHPLQKVSGRGRRLVTLVRERLTVAAATEQLNLELTLPLKGFKAAGKSWQPHLPTSTLGTTIMIVIRNPRRKARSSRGHSRARCPRAPVVL